MKHRQCFTYLTVLPEKVDSRNPGGARESPFGDVTLLANCICEHIEEESLKKKIVQRVSIFRIKINIFVFLRKVRRNKK